jgi:hypothetical protein
MMGERTVMQEALFYGGIILVAEEERLPPAVAALGDVMGDVQDDDAGKPDHGSVLRADRRRVN